MRVFKKDTVPKEPRKAPLFTGTVFIQSFIGPDVSQRFMIGEIHFEKSVRNKFHKHATEQVLIVTAGKGIVATEKEEVPVIPGDIIFIPAEEIHWHGAAPSFTFSHIAISSPGSETTQTEE